ncbi:MAG: CRISPR-associated endonuclease Cas3'' [Promethearchaeota archaeon]
MEIYSHPGILLKKHLRDVGELIEKHLNSTHFSEDFPICIEDLKNIGYLIGVFHDFGKFSSFFQNIILAFLHSFVVK